MPEPTKGPLKAQPKPTPVPPPAPEPTPEPPAADPTPSPKVKLVAFFEMSYRDNPAATPILVKVAAPDYDTAVQMVTAFTGSQWVRGNHEGKILVLTENQ